MTGDNTKIDKSVKKARQLIDLILHIDDDGAKIENALNKLAKSLIKIDGKEPDFWDVAVMEHDNVSNFAEQIEEEQKNEMFGSDSFITDQLKVFYEFDAESKSLITREITGR